MGSPISQVQMPQQQGQVQGKGQSTSSLQAPANMPQPQDVMSNSPMPQPSGKGGRITYPGQGGQPRMGQPNQYSNTVGPWDNATIQQPVQRSGKGKGA